MTVFKTAFTTGLAILCLCSTLQAQNQNDTVRVEVSDNASLEYIFKKPKDFSSFQDVNIDSLTNELAYTISKFPNNLDTTLNLNSANKSTELTRERTQSLEITGKLGVNLIRHTLVPDYGLRVSVNLFNEIPAEFGDLASKRTTSFYAEYQHMLFFERDPDLSYERFGNGFVNLGFGFQSNNNGMALNLGYLVKPAGTYFGENTFKAEFQYSLADRFSMSPFIIATDNFNSFIPGVRVALLN